MRLPELRLCGFPSVARETGSSRSGPGGDNRGFAIDAANDVILHFDEEHVPFGVETDFIRLVAERPVGGHSIAAVAHLSRTGDGGNEAGPFLDAADAMILH